MKKPNFFILGAPKCGTTSLAYWLSEHPQVFMSPVKEPNYFNFDYGRRRTCALSQYEALFSMATEAHRAVGEASPRYLYSRTAITGILKYAFEPLFIVMLRDPVEMAAALYDERVFHGDEHIESFEDAWECQEERLYGGRIKSRHLDPQMLMYGSICSLGEQLERLYRHVDRSRVHLVFMDDLKENAGREYGRIIQFLGLEPDARTEFPIRNSAKAPAYRFLNTMLKKSNDILHRIGVPHIRLGLTETINTLNRKSIVRQQMAPAFERKLRQYFVSDIELLESLSGKDLTAWKPDCHG